MQNDGVLEEINDSLSNLGKFVERFQSFIEVIKIEESFGQHSKHPWNEGNGAHGWSQFDPLVDFTYKFDKFRIIVFHSLSC